MRNGGQGGPPSGGTSYEPFQDQIDEAKAEKSAVVISCPALSFSFASFIIGQAGDTLTLKNTIPPQHIDKVIYQKQFYLALNDAQFYAPRLGGNGVDFLFKIQKSQSFSSMRKFARTRISASKNVQLEYANPFDGQTVYRKKILTLSEGGLSFETNSPSQLLVPRQKFAGVKVLIDGKTVREGDIELVFGKRFFDSIAREKYQVGAKFISGGVA